MTGKNSNNIAEHGLHMNAGTGTRQWPSVKILCLVLGIIAFVLYANTLGNDYAVDDVTVITENSYVTQGIKGIPDILTTPRLNGFLKLPTDSYRPVSLILFAIEYQFWGANPVVGHLTSLLLFAAAVIMLFLLLHRFFDGRRTAVAFITALLFAVHPIHTEVVANIKSCDEVLACLFGITSLVSFLAYAQNGKTIRLAWGILAYLLACLSKESIVTFVAVVPLIFFAYHNQNTRRSLFITAATIGATLLFLLVHRAVLGSHNTGMPGADDFTTNALLGAPSLATRIPTAFLVLGKYLLLLVIPYPLLCNYSYSSIPFVSWGNPGALASVAIYCALFGVAIWRLATRGKDAWAFAILFYLITLSLFSNVFFLITSQMAERFLFIPSIGFCMAAALALELLKNKGDVTKVVSPVNKKVWILLLPVVLTFSTLTIARNADWKDNYTLFSADVEKAPDDCKLNYYKAISIPADANDSKAIQEKISYLQKALTIYPDFQEAHTSLAGIYEAAGMPDSTLAHSIAVLKLNRENSIATYYAAKAYFALKKYDDAVAWFKATNVLNPQYRSAYLNLARCYAEAKVTDSAIAYFHKTLSLDPGNVMAQRGLAFAFMDLKNFDSAAFHMSAVIAAQPGNPDDRNNLGAIYLSAGNYPQAIEQFRNIVTANPGYVVAWGNLANTYLQAGMYDEAIANFRKQLSLSPTDGTNIPNLVTAYEKTGKRDSAAIYRAMLK